MTRGRRTRLLRRRGRHGDAGGEQPRREARIPSEGERGFTLVELVVAMALSLVVGAAALTFMVVTFDQQNDISSRAVAGNQAEVGLEQLERDLREAITSVSISTSGSSTSISFQIPTPGSDTTGEAVTWTCPSTAESSTYFAGTCTRAITPSGGSTTTKTEITGVQSMSFTPTYGGTATTPTNATDIAAVAMTMTVQITDYGLSTHNNAAAILPVDGQGAPASSTGGSAPTAPIVLQATADLRNFG
jgi:prepilin-type N-terminal cleavage/methylation domain-containing protein